MGTAAFAYIGYGLATLGPGLGIGIACYGCCVGTARQRGGWPSVHELHHGAALAEALALIGFVLAFIL